MNREEILKTLDKYNLNKDECIILSGASLVAQGITKNTNDIDIATTTNFYNSLNWQKKIGALGKEIKFIDNLEISNNLYEPEKVVTINGYKFANLDFVLEVKEMLFRLKDKNIIKNLRNQLYNKSLLNFLGTGDMSNYKLKNTSAYIKFDKTMLLIDCGMTTYHELLKKDLLNNLDEIYIAITHTHPDHVGSLTALILYLHFGTNVKINVIVNKSFYEQENHLKNLLKSQGANENYYNFIDISEINSFFKINSKRINHCPELDSYAYEIIVDDETTYYYLGDNNDIEFYQNTLLKLRKNDYIFTDISNKKSNVHLNLYEIQKCTPLDKRSQIYLMHFNEEDTIVLANELGFMVAAEE